MAQSSSARDSTAGWAARPTCGTDHPQVAGQRLGRVVRCGPVGHVTSGDPLGDEAEQDADHARARLDGHLGRGGVAGHGAAVEQGVAAGLGDGPGPEGVRRGEQPVGPALVGRGLHRGLDGIRLGTVGVDEQQGEQLVAVGDVAVDRRRHHAEVTGHRAQAQPGGAVLGEVLPADLRGRGP